MQQPANTPECSQPNQKYVNFIKELRQDTLRSIEDIAAKALECELPEIPSALSFCRKKLEENRYLVLVVGETRRGKSSFINALIGRRLLPVDVEVTTSQVFSIRPAAKEHYRLRFVDGSTRDIGVNELATFGSQVAADTGDTPHLDQIIDTIEVEIPIRYLPPGVELLDTPGLGALFAAHAQITHRFIPQAEAVIYTLDSTQPIGNLDIETIETILKSTPSVFFIQTKIDAFKQSQWQEIRLRNEKILKDRFGDRLADTRVWPISSKNLIQASETNDEDYLIVSQHRQLAAALNIFLYRVAGVNRTGMALALALQHQVEGNKILIARLSSLRRKSGGADERAAHLKALKRDWDQSWLSGGTRRREVEKNLMQFTRIAREGFFQALTFGGDVGKPLREKIRSLSSPSQAGDLAKHLIEELPHLCHKRWSSSYQNARDNSLREVEPFLEEAASIANKSLSVISEGGPEIVEFRQLTHGDSFDKASRAVVDMGRASAILGAAGAVATGVATGAGATQAAIAAFALGPVGAVIGLAAGIWVIYRGFKGWRSVNETQLRSAQTELERHLSEALAASNSYYFSPRENLGRGSIVDEQLKELCNNIISEVDRLARQRSSEIGADIERVEGEAKLDAQQREAKDAVLRDQLKTWDGLGKRLQQEMDTLNRLSGDLNPAAAATA